MKKIIRRKSYNTDSAKFLGTTTHMDPSQPEYWEESLFVKRTGEYFIYGKGGPMSRYARKEAGSWTAGEDITPVSLPAAKNWVDSNLGTDKWEQLFMAADTADTSASRKNIYMPDRIWAMAEGDARVKGMSLSGYLAALIAKNHKTISDQP